MIFKFSIEQAQFLDNELSLQVEPEKEYDLAHEKASTILDYCMNAEVYEVQNMEDDNEKELSKRGKTACSLCDLMIPKIGFPLPQD